MPAHALDAGPLVATAALEPALGQALRRTLGAGRVTVVDRHPTPYRSSFALEELTVRLDTGVCLSLMFKDLSPRALLDGARDAKPDFLCDPRREIAVYRDLLAPHRLPAPRYYGSWVDEDRGRYWLFIERVAGVPLAEVGELAVWQAAARELASLHRRFAGTAAGAATAAPLIRYDAAYYAQWPERAVAFLRDAQPAPSDAILRALQRLREAYGRVVAELTALPATLLHGECYAANVLVQETPEGRRMAFVDWEMAALGPGLVDLAALTAGRWTEPERATLAAAYAEALGDGAVAPPDRWARAFECCRLHLALQQLGWSRTWSAPPHHAHDWLSEALRLAERVELLR